VQDIKKLLESSGVKRLPPISETALTEFERSLPGPLPNEIRELLLFTTGFDQTEFEWVSFEGKGRELWSAETVGLPDALPMCFDGYGNCWAIDVHKDGSWNDVFFLCHDPPCVFRQFSSLYDSVRTFLEQDINPKPKQDDWPYNEVKMGPGAAQSQALDSNDSKIREFAKTLQEDFHIFDLREGSAINTFEWYLESEIKRFGEENIFAVQDPKPKKGFWAAIGSLFGKK
jgi:hypothetical protein